MLTNHFYTTLATLIQGGPLQWGPLSIAIGQGLASWDRTPPLLSRDRTTLTSETARRAIRPEEIEYLTNSDEVSVQPTPRLRVQTTFPAGEGSGTLRECGLFMGEDHGAALLVYFIHPRLEKGPEAELTRSMQLDLTPGRAAAVEIPTRYLGNAYSEEIHDLDNQTDGCQINEIRIDRRHFFNTVEEALNLGYDYCAYCFGRDLSER